MSVKMDGQISLPEPRERVWERLNDPDMLRRCIPDCESVEALKDGLAVSAVVKATFRGKVTLFTIEKDQRYRIEGRGDGGIAGFAKGSADVTLGDCPGGCILSYCVDAQIGGKLAQLGSRLVNSIAKKNADRFFNSFLAEMESLESTR